MEDQKLFSLSATNLSNPKSEHTAGGSGQGGAQLGSVRDEAAQNGTQTRRSAQKNACSCFKGCVQAMCLRCL